MAEWVENKYRTFVETEKTDYFLHLESLAGIVISKSGDDWKFNLGNTGGDIKSPNSHLAFKTLEEAKEAALVDACYLVGQLHRTLVDMRIALSNQMPRD